MQPYMINIYQVYQKYQQCNIAGLSMIMQFQRTNQLLATTNLEKSTDSMSASSSSLQKTIHKQSIKSTFKYHNNYKIKIHMKQLKIRIKYQQNGYTLLDQHHHLLDSWSQADRPQLVSAREQLTSWLVKIASQTSSSAREKVKMSRDKPATSQAS